jgi:hypothetical protein
MFGLVPVKPGHDEHNTQERFDERCGSNVSA